jgi:serine protease
VSDNSNPDFDRRSFLKATGAVSAAAAFSGVSSAHEDDGHDGSGSGDDEAIVGYSGDDIHAFADRIDAGTADGIPADAEVVKVNAVLGHVVLDLSNVVSTLDTAMATMEQQATDVKWSESNHERQLIDPIYPDEYDDALVEDDASAQVTPDDPKFADQYAPQQCRADLAWEKTYGSDDVTIAVVDQGVKYDHPDLADRFGSNKGKDFVDDDDDPMPTDLQNEIHGTHVAGIASATTGNSVGVAGMSNSRLLSCRALSAQGGGSPADIADAIQWAADQGADVINMSLGSSQSMQAVKDACNYAYNEGVLLLASAGNNCSEGVGYPAQYDTCVAVSAVDTNQYLASFSQYGENVEVTGPGVNVLSTWPNETDEFGKYNKISGTSMSCPAVAGVAALGKAENPDTSPSELRQLLKDSAVDVGLTDKEQGAGRADAANIVDLARDDSQKPNADVTVDITDPHVDETVIFEAAASSDAEGRITEFQWDFGNGDTASGPKQHYTFGSTGTKTVELTVTDDDGQSASTTREIAVQAGRPGRKENSKAFSGTIGEPEGRKSFTYSFQYDPSAVEATLDSQQDFVWGVIHNDNVYTPCGGAVNIPDYKLIEGKQLQIVVVSRKPRGGGSAPTGDFTVNLTEKGFGDSAGNKSPTASFTASSTEVDVSTEVSFDASGSGDEDGQIETYAWDFGDGNSANGETASHAYTEAGDYTVTLTVTDDEGSRDQASKTVHVSTDQPDNTAPDASFSLDASEVPVGDAVGVDASASSDGDGSIASYDWAFGDGSEASGVTASHAYESAGDYEIALTVTDDDDATDTVTRTVSVVDDGDAGECGDSTDVSTAEGSLAGWWDSETYTASMTLSDPCSVEFALVGPSSADFDLYVTTDGRTPTTSDYDAKSASYGSEEAVAFSEGLSGDDEFGVLVDAYDGNGDYVVTMTESGTGGSGGGNDAPNASAAADSTDVTVGQTVTFSATGSSDPDGSIASYDWTFGDGASDSGQTVTHAYESAGDYTATLTVTDDDGATAQATVTVSVADGTGECGSQTATSSAEGSLAGWWDDQRFAWTPDLDNPCQVTLGLEGAAGTDFDLYVAKGREPTTRDYDARSVSPTSTESIVLDDVEGDTEMMVLVDSYSGSGSFTLTAEENGK